MPQILYQASAQPDFDQLGPPYDVPDTAVYNPEIHSITTRTPVHARVVNDLLRRIIWNVHAVWRGLQSKAELDSTGHLPPGLLPLDIDCGFWGEEEVKQVAAHDATPFAHAKLRVDGNITAGAPGGGINPAATLEAHSMDERAHPDLLLDGNVTESAGKEATLEEHLRDRAVHGDIVLDGNL